MERIRGHLEGNPDPPSGKHWVPSGAEYPRPEQVGGGQAEGDAFGLDGFDRLIGAKLGIKGSDWGKPYSQITQWGDRKLAYALERSITGTQWTPGIPRETTRRPRPIPRRREATGMAP